MKKLQIGLAIVIGALVFIRLGQKLAVKEPSAPAYGSVANFSLTDQNGKPFSLADLKGSYWVTDFVFSRCMGPCPLLTTNMARLEAEYKNPKLKFVSFSVDPEHDTPKILADYAQRYGANTNRWTFLTGKKETVYNTIRNSFKLAVEPPQKPGSADFIHSLYFVLVGPDGAILGYYDSTDPVALDRLKADLRKI